MVLFVLDWDDIKEQGLDRTWQQQATEFPALADLEKTQECHFAEPVTATIKARWIADLLEVSGEVHSSVEICCSRCLKQYPYELSGRFFLTFTREMPEIESSIEDDAEIELTPDDMGLIHEPGEQINLHDPVAEQVIMALPVRPLCADQCLGLCASCGKDLNQGDCGCEKQVFNNKFAALKDLKLD